MLDGPTSQPKFPHLRMRHHPVLPIGERTQEGVRRTRSHFDSYVMSK